MTSIDGLARSLLLPAHAQSAVSQSEFIDRIVRSPNLSLAQFAKTTICRIVRENIFCVDKRVADSLLSELASRFRMDDAIKTLRQQLMRDSVRDENCGYNGSQFSAKLRKDDEHGSHFSARVRQRINAVSEVQPPPFTLANRRRVDSISETTPVHRTSSVLAATPTYGFNRPFMETTPVNKRNLQRTPLRDIFRDFSSSSSDSDSERSMFLHPRKLREARQRRLLRGWHKLTNRRTATFILTHILLKAKQRKALKTLFWSASDKIRREESIEESAILVHAKSSLRVKEVFFDHWRNVFQGIMEERRRQVEGLFRLVNALERRIVMNTGEALGTLSMHARVLRRCEAASTSLRIMRKVVKKRILAMFSEFRSESRVRGIQRELLRIRVANGLEKLGGVLSKSVNIGLRIGLSRIRVLALRQRLRQASRRSHIQAWRRLASHQETRNKAIYFLAKIFQKIHLRTKFEKLKVFSRRAWVRGVAKLTRVVVERSLRPSILFLRRRVVLAKMGEIIVRNRYRFAMERLVDHSRRKAAVMTVHTLGLARLLESRNDKLSAWSALKHNAGNRRLTSRIEELEVERCKVRGQIGDLSDSVRERSVVEAKVASLERANLMKFVVGQWREVVRRRKQMHRLVRVVSETRTKRLVSVIEAMRANSLWFKHKRTGVKQLVKVVLKNTGLSESLIVMRRNAFAENPRIFENLQNRQNLRVQRRGLSEWRRIYFAFTSLRKGVAANQERVTRQAFDRLKQNLWRRELLEALSECDQWALLTARRVRATSAVVDRMAIEHSKIVAKSVLIDWWVSAKERKRTLEKIACVVSRAVGRFSFRVLVVDRKRMILGTTAVASVISRTLLRLKLNCLMELRVHGLAGELGEIAREREIQNAEKDQAMRDLEAAARDLESDYTRLHERSKKVESENESLQNALVVKESQLQHEAGEVEVLLIKLREAKESEYESRSLCEKMRMENGVLAAKAHEADRLEKIGRDQESQIETMRLKLDEFAKLSASIQFYKNKVSLQNEQIASLQGKLRESTEDVLYSSPIHARSQDLTYASSSLRGLQQAVDRSTALRSAARRSDLSMISNDSTRRRQTLI